MQVGTSSVLSVTPKQLWRWRWQCLFCNLQFRLCAIALERPLAHKNQNHWDWASPQERLFDPGSQSPSTKFTQTHIFISFLHCFQWGLQYTFFPVHISSTLGCWVALHEFNLVLQRPLHCFFKNKLKTKNGLYTSICVVASFCFAFALIFSPGSVCACTLCWVLFRCSL